MLVSRIGAQPARSAPLPNGPKVEILLDERQDEDRFAAASVELAPGAGMPEHTHGNSGVVLFVREGQVELSSGSEKQTLDAGAIARISPDERIGVRNPGTDITRLLVVFSPPSFIGTFDGWPQGA
jgi:quercetin dioxygenase-like cupin family protein